MSTLKAEKYVFYVEELRIIHLFSPVENITIYLPVFRIKCSVGL